MNTLSSIPPEQIIVFLGPSLPVGEAKKILPNAFYLPPVRCGDILFALRLKPSMLVIIDGFFEHTPAVWHKEILFALSKKVIVAGASSMGALRAAELAEFGMIGSGKIFMDYLQGHIIDDDEVTVLHQPQEFSYTALTDAMVNIRATLTAAYENKIIDLATMQEITQQAKQLNYQQRTLKKALQMSPIEKSVLADLENWLQAGGFVDQKKQDAIELLQTIADKKLLPATAPTVHVNQTIFLRSLQQYVACRPFSSEQDWLPIREKMVLAVKSLADYPLLVRLAHWLGLVYSFVETHAGFPPPLGDDESTELLTISSNVSDPNWAQQHDCSEQEKLAFRRRIKKIDAVLIAQSLISNTSPQDYLLYAMRLFGDFDKYQQGQDNMDFIVDTFRQQDRFRFNIMQSLSVLWWFIDQHAEQLKLFPQSTMLQKNSDKLRQQKNLLTKEATEEWLKQNNFNLASYQKFIVAITRFKLIQNQPDILNIQYADKGIFWLYDALCLTDSYQAAKTRTVTFK